jgi:hypothetical protein
MNPKPEKRYPGSLPRLPPQYYQGDAMVHWTLPLFDRATVGSAIASNSVFVS